jgi:hypothetical protein
MRLYDAKHNGKFPNELSNNTDIYTLDEPVIEIPCTYRRSGSKAVLKLPALEKVLAKYTM